MRRYAGRSANIASVLTSVKKLVIPRYRTVEVIPITSLPSLNTSKASYPQELRLRLKWIFKEDEALRIKGLIIDLDGCVYVGNKVVEGVPEALEELAKRGIKLLYLTNNSSKTAYEYSKKLKDMGIKAETNDILTSAEATACYIAERYGARGKKVFLIGSEAFKAELEKRGLAVVDSLDVDFVVLGVDFSFNYDKLTKACRAILRGAKFIASNLDATIPSEEGILPGAGSLASAVTKATGVKPIVVGKPSKRIILEALRRLGVGKEEVAIVGDRIETDIKAGKSTDIYTILVLTGVTSLEKLLEVDEKLRPDLVIDSLADIVKALEHLS